MKTAPMIEMTNKTIASLRSKFLNKMPWRIQGLLGERPRKMLLTIQNDSDCTHVTQAASGGYIQLKKPITFSEPLHNTFNENFMYPSQPLYCVELSKGRVFRNNSIFSVINKEQRLLKPLSFDPLQRKNHPVFSEPYLPIPKKLKGKTLMIATLGADTVYFHWILDMLPRIYVSELAGHSLDSFDHILVNPFTFNAQKESFELLKVPTEKLVFVSDHDYFECETLVVPSLMFHNPISIKFLRRLFMTTCVNKTQKKIFISRSKPTWRRILNDNEVSKLLDRYGFTTVELENLSITEQADVFNSADIIVSTHGAGLTNIVFGNPGSTVIELIASWHKNVDYWICASYNQMNYHYLGCQTTPSHEELSFAQTQNYNIVVDTALLEKHIQHAIQQKNPGV